jgi:chromosomal replication initiator protein
VSISDPDLWEKCLGQIKKEISEQNYSTWFEPTRLHSITKDELILTVPNTFYKDCLQQNYIEIIESAITLFNKSKIKISFKPEPVKLNTPQNEIKNSGLQHTYTGGNPPAYPSSSINPKFNFENFIVGSSNQFAHAAALSVANNPKVTYNPLFLYAGVGLGKTHLLHAMGNAIIKISPRTRVRYLSAESFTVDLIESLKQDDMQNFRARYRPLDVLFVDDIQFLAGKERTQEEFFYTFNTLYESHKQVILSSDSYPKDMRNIEERLRSRFESGLVADIEPPDLETKIAIIFKKAEVHNKAIPVDVASFIASNIKTNVRELEGLLLRVIAYSSFTNREIDLTLTQEVLREFVYDKNKNFNIATIMMATAFHFEIKTYDLKSKKRSRQISIPRQIAMYLCREHTKLSLPEIGRHFGGKDHTTVIFAHKKCTKLIKEDNDLKKTVKIIIENIESGKTLKNNTKKSE